MKYQDIIKLRFHTIICLAKIGLRVTDKAFTSFRDDGNRYQNTNKQPSGLHFSLRVYPV